MRLWFRAGSFAIVALCFIAYRVYTVNSNFAQSSADSIVHVHVEGRRLEGECVEPADPAGLAALYALGVLWLFVALAVVADEFFCPALEIVGDNWGLSPDVAGATLMAAGGSSPELFTSATGTFLRSSVGFGAIVGSAVFNLLFVVGVCGLSTTELMQLTWWPMLRDSTCYIVVLILLAIFFGVITPGSIEWWEALILFACYWVYVFIMTQNQRLFTFFNNLFFPKRSGADDMDSKLISSVDTEGTSTRIGLQAPEEVNIFREPRLLREGLLRIVISGKSFSDTAGTVIVSHLAATLD
jgi:sodium/potassium/calcium exchanger 2